MTNTTMPAPATMLRERMIEDMKVHRLCRTTQRNQLRDVERFAIWLGRPPDTATDEDLRRYQVEQSEMGFGASAMNTAVSALRFFCIRTLDRPDLTRKLHRVKHSRGLPTVLSRDEVGRMLNATTSIKHQAILSVAYGAGLLAGSARKSSLARARELLQVAPEPANDNVDECLSTIACHARAAAGTWSSSRPSSAGGNHGLRRH